MSINFEKKYGMWERGKLSAMAALRERATVRKETADSQGKAGWENGSCGHLRPAQPGSHTLHSFVSGDPLPLH